MNRIRIIALSLSLVLATACSGGLLRSFRVGMNVTLPFVAQLVTEGVISQAIATKVTADINDGINAAVNCDTCLKSITVTDSAKQAAKAKCYVALAGDLKGILARHNIGGVEQLSRIARIIEAGIAAFEEYSRDIGADQAPGMRVMTDAEMRNVGIDPDKKLEKSIKQFKEDLREATKATDKSGKIRYLIPRDSDFLVAR